MPSPFAWPRTLLALIYAAFFSHVVHAKVDSLFTSSVTYCVPPEAILIQEFSIVYFAANQSVSFNISAASVQPNLRVRANILLNVYGMQPVNVTQDFCSVFGNALCPLPTYNFTGSSSIALPSSINVASKVPSIAYKIPDLESFAQLTLTDVNTGNVAACIQATLSNGWSTHQPAVAYTTGAFALFALFSALLHSLLPSTPLSPMSLYDLPSIAPARFVDCILLFQQLAFTGFLHLNFPLVYRAFTLNFAWALGLFPNSRPIQLAVDRMRHLTGGSLQDGVQSPTAFVNRQLSPYNAPVSSGSSPSSFLALANAAFLAANRTLTARDTSTDSSSGNGPPATVTTGDSDILPAGIPVYVNSLNIGTTDAFMSVFFTVLIGAVVGAGVLGVMHVVLTFMVTRLRGNKWAWTDVMHAELQWFAVSNGIRYAMVVLYPVLIFTFFQWTLRDSWLAVLLSVMLLLCTAAAILYPAVRTLLIARRSSPEALYTTPSLLRTLGAFYIPLREGRYGFFVPLLGAAVLKSVFIGFAKTSGLAQVVGLLVVEVGVLGMLCVQRPYRARGGDVLGVYLGATRVAAGALMLPFVESLRIKAIPRVAVGFVLIVLFGSAVVVMCGSVVVSFGTGLLWRRHGGGGGGGGAVLRSLSGGGGSSEDVEKGGGVSGSDTPATPPPPPPGADSQRLRPVNPTPNTSFSNDASVHSRHTPKMTAAVSPNYTIPSFYTSEEEEEEGEGEGDNHAVCGGGGGGEDTPRDSTRPSSFLTASSPPSTAQHAQFPRPPDHTPAPPSQDHDRRPR